MIASIRGILTHKSPQYLIVDVHGVGYQIYTSLQSFYHLPEPKESVALHTYTHLREDTLQLYGFLTSLEREVFLLLLGVSGIGPKSALNILSGLSVADLVEAVKVGDLRKLTSVPGIGAKTAGRLALELKDKLLGLTTCPEEGVRVGSSNPQHQRIFEDALSALVNLGYHRNEAKEAIRQIVQGNDPDGAERRTPLSVEELVRSSLKMLSKS